MTECAEYKLTVSIYADEIGDLEQLLCVIADKVLDGAVTGSGGGCIGSYTFNLEEHLKRLLNEKERQTE